MKDYCLNKCYPRNSKFRSIVLWLIFFPMLALLPESIFALEMPGCFQHQSEQPAEFDPDSIPSIQRKGKLESQLKTIFAEGLEDIDPDFVPEYQRKRSTKALERLLKKLEVEKLEKRIAASKQREIINIFQKNWRTILRTDASYYQWGVIYDRYPYAEFPKLRDGLLIQLERDLTGKESIDSSRKIRNLTKLNRSQYNEKHYRDDRKLDQVIGREVRLSSKIGKVPFFNFRTYFTAHWKKEHFQDVVETMDLHGFTFQDGKFVAIGKGQWIRPLKAETWYDAHLESIKHLAKTNASERKTESFFQAADGLKQWRRKNRGNPKQDFPGGFFLVGNRNQGWILKAISIEKDSLKFRVAPLRTVRHCYGFPAPKEKKIQIEFLDGTNQVSGTSSKWEIFRQVGDHSFSSTRDVKRFGLPPSSKIPADIRFSFPGYQPVVVHQPIGEDGIPVERLKVSLKPQVERTIYVVDHNNLPVPEFEISYSVLGQNNVWLKTEQEKGVNGKIVLKNLGNYVYSFVLTAKGKPFLKQTVRVWPEKKAFQFRFKKSVNAKLKLLGDSKKPIVGAKAFLLGQFHSRDQEYHSFFPIDSRPAGVSGPKGIMTVSGLETGLVYNLMVRLPDGSRLHLSDVKGGEQVKTISVHSPTEIEVILDDWESLPDSKITISGSQDIELHRTKTGNYTTSMTFSQKIARKDFKGKIRLSKFFIATQSLGETDVYVSIRCGRKSVDKYMKIKTAEKNVFKLRMK